MKMLDDLKRIEAMIKEKPWLNGVEVARQLGMYDTQVSVTLNRFGLRYTDLQRNRIKELAKNHKLQAVREG